MGIGGKERRVEGEESCRASCIYIVTLYFPQSVAIPLFLSVSGYTAIFVLYREERAELMPKSAVAATSIIYLSVCAYITGTQPHTINAHETDTSQTVFDPRISNG